MRPNYNKGNTIYCISTNLVLNQLEVHFLNSYCYKSNIHSVTTKEYFQASICMYRPYIVYIPVVLVTGKTATGASTNVAIMPTISEIDK